MGRLVGNERMEAEGVQKATAGAYVDPDRNLNAQPGTMHGQPGGYPPADF